MLQKLSRLSNPILTSRFFVQIQIHKVRAAFVEVLKKEFADLGLTYSIGGQISFDVLCVHLLGVVDSVLMILPDVALKDGTRPMLSNMSRRKGSRRSTSLEIRLVSVYVFKSRLRFPN